MTRRKQYSCDDFNDVLNVCDLMLQEENLNVFKDKEVLKSIKQEFLENSRILFTDSEQGFVTVELTEGRVDNFNFLLGYSFNVFFEDYKDFKETDYAQLLKGDLKQKFTYKNEDDGYTVLTVRENDKRFYVCNRHILPTDATFVSKAVLDSIKSGLAEYGYTLSGGDKITELNDEYVSLLYYCIRDNEVDVDNMMFYGNLNSDSALDVVSWMEGMGYISMIKDKTFEFKVNMTMDEFIAKYGNIEVE